MWEPEVPNWQCAECGAKWLDRYATSPAAVDGLTPPECERCGNETGNIWIGGND